MRWLFVASSLVFLCCAAARPTVVPLVVTAVEPGHYRVEVVAKFGDEPETFLLDTGAPTSTLRASSRTERFPARRANTSQGVAGVALACDEVELTDVTLGSSRRPTFTASRCQDSNTKSLLGLDALGNRFQVDLRNQQLIFEPQIAPTDALKRLSAGHVTLPAQLGAVNVNVLFDTGADTTVIDRTFVTRHPELFTHRRSEEGRDATGQPVASTVYSLTSLRIGALHLRDVEVAAIDFPEPMRRGLGNDTPVILGTNVIEPAVWSFDLVTNRWLVVPHVTAASTLDAR